MLLSAFLLVFLSTLRSKFLKHDTDICSNLPSIIPILHASVSREDGCLNTSLCTDTGEWPEAGCIRREIGKGLRVGQPPSRAPYVVGVAIWEFARVETWCQSIRPSHPNIAYYAAIIVSNVFPNVNTFHLKSDIVFDCLLSLLILIDLCGCAFEQKIARFRSMRTRRDYNR